MLNKKCTSLSKQAWVKPKFLIIVIKNKYTKSQKHFLSFAKLPKTIQEYNFYCEEYNFQAPPNCLFDFHMY